METMFIDFKGHILKLVIKDGKPRITESNKEEMELAQADLILLDNDPEEVLKNVYNTTINNAFKDIEEGWKKDLKKNVMRLIGFSDTWGKWEIDYCNGRTSDMSHLITHEVKKMFLETNFTPEQLTLTKKEKEEFCSSIKKDLREKFEYRYRQFYMEALEKAMKEQAIKDAKEQFEEMTKSIALDTNTVLKKLNSNINKG